MPDTAVGISDAIGGGLLDDTITGRVQARRYVVYLDVRAVQTPVTLPDNPRAAVLAARLGHTDRALQQRLRGPALVTGLRPDTDNDIDVPDGVLTAARRSGVLLGPGTVQSVVTAP